MPNQRGTPVSNSAASPAVSTSSYSPRTSRSPPLSTSPEPAAHGRGSRPHARNCARRRLRGGCGRDLAGRARMAGHRHRPVRRRPGTWRRPGSRGRSRRRAADHLTAGEPARLGTADGVLRPGVGAVHAPAARAARRALRPAGRRSGQGRLAADHRAPSRGLADFGAATPDARAVLQRRRSGRKARPRALDGPDWPGPGTRRRRPCSPPDLHPGA